MPPFVFSYLELALVGQRIGDISLVSQYRLLQSINFQDNRIQGKMLSEELRKNDSSHMCTYCVLGPVAAPVASLPDLLHLNLCNNRIQDIPSPAPPALRVGGLASIVYHINIVLYYIGFLSPFFMHHLSLATRALL